jgi:Mg/Co/Ni transporter MgtE
MYVYILNVSFRIVGVYYIRYSCLNSPTVRISALVEKVSNKSQARQKEKALIKMLKKHGVFLLSDTDQSHQLFGSGLQDIVS